MSTLLVVLLVVVTEVMGDLSPHAHQHRRFSRSVETSNMLPIENKECSDDHRQEIEEGVIKTRCNDPKEVFLPINGGIADNERMIPPSVWVKRCVGRCYTWSYDITDCLPLRTLIKFVEVRIYDTETRTERCASVPVDEHVECGALEGPVRLCQNYTSSAVLALEFEHMKDPSRSVETISSLPSGEFLGANITTLEEVCIDKVQQKIQQGHVKSQCFQPKKVFVALDGMADHEVMIPSSVWVKRCVGICYNWWSEITDCVPIKNQIKIKYVPVRIYDTQTRTERCASVPVEEHVECGARVGRVTGLCYNYTSLDLYTHIELNQ